MCVIMKLCQTKNSMCTSPNKHATRNEKYANIVSAEVKRKKLHQTHSERFLIRDCGNKKICLNVEFIYILPNLNARLRSIFSRYVQLNPKKSCC